MEARDIKPGHRVTRPATQRGEPPLVTRTVSAVSPLGNVGVRVTFTDNTVILMLASNPVVCDNAP